MKAMTTCIETGKKKYIYFHQKEVEKKSALYKLMQIVGRTRIRENIERKSFLRAYKGENVLENYDSPGIEGTRLIDEG